MKIALAIRNGIPLRTINALLRYEPRLLDGLTWSHFGYVALLAVGFAVIRAAGSRFDSPQLVIWNWIPLSVICGLVVLLCGVLLTNLKLQWIPRPIVLAIAVIVGCLLALQLHLWVWVQHPVPLGYWFHKLRIVLLQWGMIAGAYYFIERSALRAAELRKAQLERHRIETQMLEAQLQVMQAQAEPHFLFNTLAHVQRLYQLDPARGRAMLGSLCDYLRSALPHMRGSCSTLGREVGLARAYLEMQQIRMGRRLRFEIAMEDELLTAAFPPMMLLSLVENAIKHGLNPLRDGGSVRVAAESHDKVLRVTVADSGAGFSRADVDIGDGVGLSNIRSRLAALGSRRARLVLRANTPRGVIATIEVPLRTERRSTKDEHDLAAHASVDIGPVRVPV